MGVACSGKSTLATNLQKMLTGIILEADSLREIISATDELDFAKKLNYIAELVVQSENWCIVDYCADTEEIRQQFTDSFIIWVDRGIKGDKNPNFAPPNGANYHVTTALTEMNPDLLARKILLEIHKWWNRPKTPKTE